MDSLNRKYKISFCVLSVGVTVFLVGTVLAAVDHFESPWSFILMVAGGVIAVLGAVTCCRFKKTMRSSSTNYQSGPVVTGSYPVATPMQPFGPSQQSYPRPPQSSYPTSPQGFVYSHQGSPHEVRPMVGQTYPPHQQPPAYPHQQGPYPSAPPPNAAPPPSYYTVMKDYK